MMMATNWMQESSATDPKPMKPPRLTAFRVAKDFTGSELAK